MSKDKAKQERIEALKASGWQIETYESDQGKFVIYFVSVDKKARINHMQIATLMDGFDQIKEHIPEIASLSMDQIVSHVEYELSRLVDCKNLDTDPLSIALSLYVQNTVAFKQAKQIYDSRGEELSGSFFVFRAWAKDLKSFVLRPAFTNDDGVLSPEAVIERVNTIIDHDSSKYPTRFKPIKDTQQLGSVSRH